MVGALRRLSKRFWNWVAPRKLEAEFLQELDEHMELLTAEYVRRGESAAQGRRLARIQVGGRGQLRDEYLEHAGLPVAEGLAADLRFALRALKKRPGLVGVCILTLALGIGATTAIFSVVNGVLLRPLPYPNSERLLRIQESHPGWSNGHVTYATFLDMERESKTIANLAAFRPWNFNMTGEGEPQQVPGAMVSGKFFAAMGTTPVIGRTLNEQDDLNGSDNHVVVLSYGLWQGTFGEDPQILNRILHINAERYRVVGVMPKGFEYPERAKLWCPLVAGGESRDNRRAHLLTVIGNVEPKGTVKASGELLAIARDVNLNNPGIDPEIVLTALPLQKTLVAPVQPALLILIAAVSLLLLLACANLANLLLAQGEARRKEFAIRISIGAGRRRLVRQLLTESVLLSLLGAVVGIAIAWQSLRLISALQLDDIPRIREISMDWRVLGFTALISLLAGILFGLAPAMMATKTDVHSTLKEGASNVVGIQRRRLGRALVILQFAFAMLLMVTAGLVGNSFVRLLQVDPGFQADGVLAVNLFFSPIEFPEGDQKGPLLLRQMLENVRAITGVSSAGLVNALPLDLGPATDFVIEGRPAPAPNDEPNAAIRTADAEYFRTMKIPLLVGREVQESDGPAAQRVIVINQTMARAYWPGANPVGQRVTMKDWGPPLTGEIVGVVGDVKTGGVDTKVEPTIYWPYAQFPQLFNAIVVRTSGDPMRLLPAVKSAIWSVASNQPISKAITMEQLLDESLARRRFYLLLLGLFSAAALLLAAMGIYGMVSHTVSARTYEMGIRMAIGAKREQVLWLMLRHGTCMALAGIAAGIALACLLTPLLATLLFGVSATDPATFAGVATLIFFVASLSTYFPVRRAARVNPTVALRCE